MTNKTTCKCFIRHAVTTEERAATTERLEYARKVNDALGVVMALMSLSGECPARA